MHDTRIGRTLDDLHPHLAPIWQDIVVQAIMEYEIDLRSLHYDITSIYFEGEYTESKKISYGYSRDHRPDAKQVNPGVNVTSETASLWAIVFWLAEQRIGRRRLRTWKRFARCWTDRSWLSVNGVSYWSVIELCWIGTFSPLMQRSRFAGWDR
jgi:hypothetical protein